jgi:hypothetical protein
VTLEAKPKRAALIIAHPGHELRVHHWLETTKPLVVVLTDGSGRTNKSRLDSTTNILKRTGATAGPVYGRFSDADIYEAILEGKGNVFQSLMDDIVQILIDSDIEFVAGDALEGYNPSHDLCRYLIGAAVSAARKKTGRKIENHDFLLIGRPDECPDELRKGAVELSLDDSALDRKLVAAQEYPELAQEVEGALKAFGKKLFSVEILRPVSDRTGLDFASMERPFYETYGEKRVNSHHYSRVIRLKEHIQPLVSALWEER